MTAMGMKPRIGDWKSPHGLESARLKTRASPTREKQGLPHSSERALQGKNPHAAVGFGVACPQAIAAGRRLALYNTSYQVKLKR